MNLKKHPTGPGKEIDEEFSRSAATKNAEKIGELQVKLYAEANQSLLVIFQGMDAAGKDGAIKKVFILIMQKGYSFLKSLFQI